MAIDFVQSEMADRAVPVTRRTPEWAADRVHRSRYPDYLFSFSSCPGAGEDIEMSFIEINGAQIYYELFGQEQPGRSPILLIHGSTITGQADWSLVAPLLARRWRVIVPDCRGHGRSSNPNLTYSFREMASDMAALIRLLGYQRAHVIGHSNGGNVALVTLLEYRR